MRVRSVLALRLRRHHDRTEGPIDFAFRLFSRDRSQPLQSVSIRVECVFAIDDVLRDLVMQRRGNADRLTTFNWAILAI
jgi:hypothetical protein